MKQIFFALLLVMSASASAEPFSIPAEEFDWHTYAKDMSGFTEDAELENVRELAVGSQLHIRYWINAELNSYVENLKESDTAFEVCATVANLGNGENNSVRINHPNPAYSQVHDLDSDQYQILCSKQGQVGDALRSAGVTVTSSSQGPVEIRNVVIRPFQESTQLTTRTSSSWELDLFRSPVSIRPNGRPTYVENEQAWTVLTVGDVVYVGGDFQNIKKNGLFADPAQAHVVAFDRHTGEPIPGLDIEVNGAVYALASSPDNTTLYVGGLFNNANGRYRKNFAAYEVENTSASLADFRLTSDGVNINPDKAVREIAVTNDTLYLAGSFTKFGGNADHGYVAAFDPVSGEIVETFQPKPNKQVTALVAGGDEGLWIGGEFNKLDGLNWVGLALVDPSTGQLDASSPIVPYPIIDLAASATQLFVASGGQNRVNRFTGNIAGAFDRATLEPQWALQGDGNVQAVDVDDGQFVYFGGHYQRFRYIRNSDTDSDGEWVVGGEHVERLSRHDKVTGEIDFTWVPFVDGIRSVNGVDVTPDGLYIVGDFFRVGGDTTASNDPRRQDHRGFAMFRGETGGTPPVEPAQLEIITGPEDTIVTEGDDATFSVLASGSGALSYQWFADDVALVDASTASLTLNQPPLDVSGTTYSVTVTDDNGSVTSAVATLTVEAAPVALAITTQPVDTTVTEGEDAVFSVVAIGDGTLSYQWRVGDTDIADATAASLALNQVTLDDAGTQYSVIVTDTNGSVISAAATLTVEAAPVALAITTQPVDTTVTEGEDAVFSVVAIGDGPLSYQWRVGDTDIASATTASLALNQVTLDDTATEYSVIVTDTNGSVTSSVATLVVTPLSREPSIEVTSPAHRSVQSNPVTFLGTVELENLDTVKVVIKDNNARQFWNGVDWQSSRIELNADVTGDQWSYSYIDPDQRDVAFRAIASSGTLKNDPNRVRLFSARTVVFAE